LLFTFLMSVPFSILINFHAFSPRLDSISLFWLSGECFSISEHPLRYESRTCRKVNHGLEPIGSRMTLCFRQRTYLLKDLRFSQTWLWRVLLPSGI
jgi:hypothetical protein